MSNKKIVGRVYNEPEKRSVDREEVVSQKNVGMTNNSLKRPAGDAKIRLVYLSGKKQYLLFCVC